MAGTVMHLVIADRLLDTLKIKNPTYFYCGNLAPDAIMNRANYDREMKRHTHFKDQMRLHELREPEHFKVYLERFLDFYRKYAEPSSPHREIYLGYVVHMLVDELYILKFRDRFVDARVALGHNPVDIEYFKIFAKDVDQIDLKLAAEHAFRYPMPEALRLKEFYEIPDYITNTELLQSKEFIIKKNFLNDKEPQALEVMTYEENLEFIELCVKEIPEILKSRFDYNF